MKAKATILANNPNFYRDIGSKGGKAPNDKPKGFAANPELAARVGAIGGRISKRQKKEK